MYRPFIMITPRTLAEDTISNSTPSIDTWQKQGECAWSTCGSPLHLVEFSCRWFSWDQSCMYSAACCGELCLEAGTTSEIVVSSVNLHMWNPSGRRRSLSSPEIAVDPNGSPGALQQEHPPNQIPLHLVSPSAVCSLENISPSSQL